MSSKIKRAVAAKKKVGESAAIVHAVRLLTEEQFDFWITCLNRAVVATGGRGGTFTRDDRQKTVSYWYLLMFLLELYAVKENAFDTREGDVGVTEGISSMAELSRDLAPRFKEETIRRYVFDLKRCGLIVIEGRGADATVRLSKSVIYALTDTMKHWMKAFRDIDSRFQKMQTI